MELIAGQACYSCLEFANASLSPTDMHDESWLAAGTDSLRRLRSLNPQLVHFSHDRTTYRSD